MAIFDFLFKKQTTPSKITTLSPFLYAGRQAVYPDWEQVMNGKYYATIDDIYSVIRYLATTAARVKSYAYMGDEPEKKITALLESPGLQMSRFAFYEAVNTYLLTDGEAFLIKEAGTQRDSLTIIAPIEMVVMTANFEVVGYQWLRNGQVVRNMLPEEVIHIKYFNSDPKNVRGLSPLKVLSNRITQGIAIDNQLTAQMQNGGVNTIVFDKAVYDDVPAVTNQRKDSFYRFISNNANKGSPYFAAGEMQAINIGNNMVEMQVLEAANIPFKKICNAYGTSDILFNSDSASTESNVREMTKRTYTNTILPNIHRINDAISLSYDLALKGIEIKEDLTEIPELQDDMTALVQSLGNAWWLTPNQKLEAMNYEMRPEPEFDMPWIGNGLRPLDEFLQEPDLNVNDESQGNYPNV